MANNMFTEIQFMVFNRIALAHTLIDNEYRYELNNVGYGIYGKCQGGICICCGDTASFRSSVWNYVYKYSFIQKCPGGA